MRTIGPASFALTLALIAGVLDASPGQGADETAPGYRSLQFDAPAPGTYDLPALGAAADGVLLDDNGRAVSLHDLLAGEVTVLSFVYTTCRDTNGCPLASFVLAGVQARLLERPDVRDRVRLVTVSFDPQHDGPEKMRAYGERLRKAPVDWRFLTARSEGELAPILAAYGQTVRKDYDADGNYLGTMSHVLRVYLIDGDRRIRNIYSTSFLHPDTLVADIDTLLLEDRGAETPPDLARPELHPGVGAPEPRQPGLAPPLGLPPLPPFAEGAVTHEKIALGRKLFFDRRLSANDTLSCAMCHVPTQGFTQNELSTPVGIEGRSVNRNAPTLYNVAYAPLLFHDGRATSLEEQVWGPLLAYNEMGNASADEVLAKLDRLDDYDGLFAQAFGEARARRETVGAALASYERTLLAAASPFDRWRFGADGQALSATAKRGFELFTGKAGCASCHALERDYALFTDFDFHDTGVGSRSARLAQSQARQVKVAMGIALDLEGLGDDGRAEVTHDAADRWKYKTPTLRNVALTPPYMHDGSLPTLEAVVEYYNAGGEPHELLDPRVHPLGLSDDEIDTLVAFLESLTGDTRLLIADALSAPIGSPK